MQLTALSLALTRIGLGGFGVGSALNLDFTSGNQSLDPRITFSRASNATVTGPDGTLGYAPHNLLTFSEQFDNAYWGKINASVASNNSAAPDGTTTSDKLVEDTATGTHIASVSGVAISSGVIHTVSVYAKAAGRSFVELRCGASSQFKATFSLTDGSASSTLGLSGSGATDAGNGWWRVWISFISDSTSLSGRIGIAQSASINSYTGDGVSGIFLWGAQLNVGPLQPYYPTTVKNLLGYTQEFDNAAWTKSNATVTANAIAAPDGSLTADKLVEDTATGQHRINPSPSTTVSGVQYTASIYMKAGERTFCATEIILTTGGVEGLFNLSAGTASFSAYGGAAAPSGSITAVGNGWYRCAVTFTANGASATVRAAKLYQNSTAQTYTGDGTSGIFIWGAQLSDSASLDPYVYNPEAAPTAQAYYGPRFDYDPVTLQPKGLLIEEQRTNGIRNNTGVGAVAGTPGTLPTNWSVSGLGTLVHNTVATGVEGGVAYADIRFSGTTSTTSLSLRFETPSGIPAASGQSWASSVHTAIVGGTTANILALGSNSNLYNSALAFVGGITFAGFVFNTSPQMLRSAGSGTIATSTAAFIQPQIFLSFASGVPIDITLRIGLPQLELGAFATSPIPTTTAAATRAADVAVMTGANFSNWYRQDEGTLFGDFDTPPGLAAFPTAIGTVSDGTTNNQATIYAHTSGVFTNVRVGGVVQGDVGVVFSPVVDARTKFAIGLAANNSVGARVGVLGLVDNAITLPVVNQLRIGAGATGSNAGNTHIHKIAYFPRRLTNSELQGLTS